MDTTARTSNRSTKPDLWVAETLRVSTRRRFAVTARRQSQSPIWCCVAMRLRTSSGSGQRISRTPISGGPDDTTATHGSTSRRTENVKREISRGRGVDVPSPGLWNERCWTRFLSADERRDSGTRLCGFTDLPSNVLSFWQGSTSCRYDVYACGWPALSLHGRRQGSCGCHPQPLFGWEDRRRIVPLLGTPLFSGWRLHASRGCPWQHTELETAAIGKDRKMNDPLTQEELTSLRSVVGGLPWISRYGRPDLAYRVNELQRCCHAKSTVQSLRMPAELLNLLCREVTSKSLSRLIGSTGATLRSSPFPMPASRMKLSTKVSRTNPLHHVPQRCEDRWAQISPDRIWIFDFEKGLSSHFTGRIVCLAGINRIWWQDSSFALRIDRTPDFSQGMVSAESASNAALVLHRLSLSQRPSVAWSCTQGARQTLRNRTLCTPSSALDQCWENFPEVLPGRWWSWMDRYRQGSWLIVWPKVWSLISLSGCLPQGTSTCWSRTERPWNMYRGRNSNLCSTEVPECGSLVTHFGKSNRNRVACLILYIALRIHTSRCFMSACWYLFIV